jgi:glycosyltransferase involved in cell wall biosynthesis
VTQSPAGRLRLAAYTDYSYRQQGDAIFGERAFVVFLSGLADWADQLLILGRLDPRPGRSHYRLPDGVRFVPLPHYDSLLSPHRAVLSMLGSLRRFWRALDDVDAVWLLGPYVHSLAFVALAALRRRRVILGVRQDTPRYVRSRHPQRRWTHWAASALEFAWRALARRYPVVVVGPDLARRYAHAPRLLTISVSLVREADLTTLEAAEGRPYDGELRVMTVGRLEPEKNPLLLADVLARLRAGDDRWRLTVCGEGPMEGELSRRLEEAGVREAADLRGYVPIDGGLTDVYRGSHAFLHVSLTEGLPAVLFEAFAAGLPVVATAVGGVGEAVGGAATLVPPDDPEAAAAALQRLAEDGSLRQEQIAAGLAQARGHTLERECARLAEFLARPTSR